MNWLCLSIFCIFLIITVILTIFDKREHFTSIFYHDLKQDVFENVKDLYSTQVNVIDEEIETIDEAITEKVNEYNSDFCSKYSKFYKIDTSKAIVDEGKTYVEPLIQTTGGQYSKERNECIYPDSSYTSSFNCGLKIQCSDGLNISGNKVIKNSKELCVYDCV